MLRLSGSRRRGLAQYVIPHAETMTNWAFKEPKNVAVFTTRSVVIERNPILRVFHDQADGAWQFHHDEDPREEDAMILALSEIVKIDESVNELSNLPLGWMACRNDNTEPWQRKKGSLRAV